MNQLPKWYHPVFNWERFTQVTDDGFFLVIEARDPKFSETQDPRAARGHRRPARHADSRLIMLRYFLPRLHLSAASSSSPSPASAARRARMPPIEIFPDMDHQPKFQPQHPSGFFADGRAARKPVDRHRAASATRCPAPISRRARRTARSSRRASPISPTTSTPARSATFTATASRSK